MAVASAAAVRHPARTISVGERSMAGLRIIKKYPNRRLYDTEISSYITIEDVRQLIIDGEEFEVRDAKSGEDLSRAVLLQIIADREQDGEPMLSTQLLSQIIRFYGDSLQGFMGNYLERSMQVFLDQQQQFRQQMGNLLGQTPWAMMNQLTERNLELWQEFQRNFGAGFGRPVGPGTPANPPGASGLGSGPIGTGTHGTPNNHHGTTGKARNRG
ncbi:polyhydroxyalkanoate synthesis repressor PhaR [Xanthomonas oryzae pv. oryzae PXO99A]|uniref:Polyhydroxyalkanoate synthesis repressor PhaR n=2 Tax=Xanthomonas oryzae pv. oryzae TaxID=64187 RepID=A0A0K0GK40_XANOP|nr:polyhydroxyalkanoate synthesis repressor PhaR [Xanthomonas oryzae pv. oryzae PXO99A]